MLLKFNMSRYLGDKYDFEVFLTKPRVLEKLMGDRHTTQAPAQDDYSFGHTDGSIQWKEGLVIVNLRSLL